jgi:hypothetical protein
LSENLGVGREPCHLRSEIEDAGFKEVVVFRSTDEALLQHHAQFPFDVIGDPEKTLCRRHGVERSLFALLGIGHARRASKKTADKSAIRAQRLA